MRYHPVLVAAFILLLSIPACARIYYIPGDAATIQGAVDMAADTDTVSVMPGSYAENIYLFDKNVSIIGDSGAAATFWTPYDLNSPVLTVYNAIDRHGSEEKNTSITMAGFTIYGGQDSHTISVDGMSSVTIRGNIFRDNIPEKVGDKAVIFCGSSSAVLYVTRNIFYGNYGSTAIMIQDGTATIVNNTLDGNRSAFMSSSNQATVINNIVSNSSGMAIDGTFLRLDYNNVWNNAIDYG